MQKRGRETRREDAVEVRVRGAVSQSRNCAVRNRESRREQPCMGKENRIPPGEISRGGDGGRRTSVDRVARPFRFRADS